MKKIILTVVLGSLLPVLAVAEGKKMQNTHAETQTQLSQSEINMKEKKHMSMGGSAFTSQSASNMKGKKHMSMGDSPFSPHNKKASGKKVTKKAGDHEGYSYIKYEK